MGEKKAIEDILHEEETLEKCNSRLKKHYYDATINLILARGIPNKKERRDYAYAALALYELTESVGGIQVTRELIKSNFGHVNEDYLGALKDYLAILNKAEEFIEENRYLIQINEITRKDTNGKIELYFDKYGKVKYRDVKTGKFLSKENYG